METECGGGGVGVGGSHLKESQRITLSNFAAINEILSPANRPSRCWWICPLSLGSEQAPTRPRLPSSSLFIYLFVCLFLPSLHFIFPLAHLGCNYICLHPPRVEKQNPNYPPALPFVLHPTTLTVHFQQQPHADADQLSCQPG